MSAECDRRRVLAISGGIGGAKLALGLYRVLAADTLTVACNPGDDFEHLGLAIRPDADTVVYTLAGVADPERGWGVAGETWAFMDALARLGGETWFRLGDRDLATHVERTRRLAAGEPLSRVTDDLARRLGVRASIVPASDDPVRTVVETADGPLAFQRYFVERRCAPAVTGFRFEGAEAARACPALLDLARAPDTRAVVVCPSNPFISIDPVLAVPGVREALRAAPAPVVAVSPVVGGDSLKGPTAKMMRELGLAVSPGAVAARWADFLDGFVVDASDARAADAIEVPCLVTGTVMRSLADRERLAREVLDFADRLR